MHLWGKVHRSEQDLVPVARGLAHEGEKPNPLRACYIRVSTTCAQRTSTRCSTPGRLTLGPYSGRGNMDIVPSKRSDVRLFGLWTGIHHRKNA